jgi:hypothetical protein
LPDILFTSVLVPSRENLYERMFYRKTLEAGKAGLLRQLSGSVFADQRA